MSSIISDYNLDKICFSRQSFLQISSFGTMPKPRCSEFRSVLLNQSEFGAKLQISESLRTLIRGHYMAEYDDFYLPMLPDSEGRFGYCPPGLVEGWMEVEYNLGVNSCFASHHSRLLLLTFSIKLSILLSFGFLTQTSQS